jgi:hypothetical protein
MAEQLSNLFSKRVPNSSPVSRRTYQLCLPVLQGNQALLRVNFQESTLNCTHERGAPAGQRSRLPQWPRLVPPQGTIDDMIQSQRAFLWTGEDKCNGAQSKLAWDVVSFAQDKARARHQEACSAEQVQFPDHFLAATVPPHSRIQGWTRPRGHAPPRHPSMENPPRSTSLLPRIHRRSSTLATAGGRRSGMITGLA